MAENITTVLELPEADGAKADDKLYLIQGTGSERDKKITAEKLMSSELTAKFGKLTATKDTVICGHTFSPSKFGGIPPHFKGVNITATRDISTNTLEVKGVVEDISNQAVNPGAIICGAKFVAPRSNSHGNTITTNNINVTHLLKVETTSSNSGTQSEGADICGAKFYPATTSSKGEKIEVANVDIKNTLNFTKSTNENNSTYPRIRADLCKECLQNATCQKCTTCRASHGSCETCEQCENKDKCTCFCFRVSSDNSTWYRINVEQCE